MDKEKVKSLIVNDGLNIMDVIDALIELNGMKGVAVVAMGVDLKGYCVDKSVNKSEARENAWRLNDLHEFPEKKRIHLLVVDGHTIAYCEEGDKCGNILASSVLKGSPYATNHDGDLIFFEGRNVRTATRKDLEEFRLSSLGYLDDSKYIIDP